MAIKKTELYSSLWASANELRGGMDASEYKDYVLTLLFMKYVSDKYKADPDSLIEVPEGASFDDMVEYLSGIWVTSKLFEVFEDGKLAEFSARAMHLEGSLQKVEKEYKKVKQKCFKATHELIDKGMRESFAAKSTKGRKKKRSAA